MSGGSSYPPPPSLLHHQQPVTNNYSIAQQFNSTPMQPNEAIAAYSGYSTAGMPRSQMSNGYFTPPNIGQQMIGGGQLSTSAVMQQQSFDGSSRKIENDLSAPMKNMNITNNQQAQQFQQQPSPITNGNLRHESPMYPPSAYYSSPHGRLPTPSPSPPTPPNAYHQPQPILPPHPAPSFGYQQQQHPTMPPAPPSFVTQQQPTPSLSHSQMQPIQHQQPLPNRTVYPGQQQQPQQRYIDLLQDRKILDGGCPDPDIRVPASVVNPDIHCDPSIFRCTLTAVPQTQELLKRCRLPLGISLHPFKDMKNLNVINTSTIVRCRSCRTYINPYVQLPDQRHWRCNLCFRVNDLPDEFMWDPATKSFGDPVRRPEIQNATVEFIAPSEYMLRPPQPAVYVFVIDVSANAIESGYLHTFSEQLLINLDQIPGDQQLMAFIGVDQGVHFFQFFLDGTPPKQYIVNDVDEVFLPTNNGILVNMIEYKEVVRNFVQSLPTIFETNHCASNALGAALTAAHMLIADIGGRITVIQTTLPNVGPGALSSREDPNMRAASEIQNLGPANDFYKRLALDCSGHQVAVDLFLLNSKYADLATLSEVSKYSSGSVYHFDNYHMIRETVQVKRFQKAICRYLTRKIGFESVLRIRCSRGLSLHTFHGNFFIRSTDLLQVANISPDSALGVQVQMDENLVDQQTVCFQAALLYTSSKAVERSLTNGGALNDAREALVNAAVDAIASFNRSIASTSALLCCGGGLRLLPLYILGLLKHPAFALGRSIKLDERLAAMCMFKTSSIAAIMLEVHPALYALHMLESQPDDPQQLQLSYERIDRHGVYLLDTGTYLYIYVGQAVSDDVCQRLFNVGRFSLIDEDNALPQLDTKLNERVRTLIRDLTLTRPLYAPTLIVREDSPNRDLVTRRLIEDKSESMLSYVEFLQHMRKEIIR